jgi:hypothetical protein
MRLSKYEDLVSRYTALKWEKLHSCCAGWMAQYELWSIKDSPPQRLALVRIPLRRADVVLQMQQSLSLDCDSQKVYMQFPIFIARRAMAFSILQTVYVLRSSLAHQLDATSASRYILASCSLSNVQPQSTVQTQKFLEPLQSGVRCRYWIRLTTDGSNAFLFVHELGSHVQIAVFNCETQSKNKMALVLLRETSLDNRGHSFDNIKVAFHPSIALLAFSMNNRVFLWAFRNGEISL